MIRWCILWFLLGAPAWAASIDLSGEWRMSRDDRPVYSQPDFDDQSWEKVALPWAATPPEGTYWLRRSIELPPGLDTTRLSIILGPLAETYHLYVNGVLAGEVGTFTDRGAVQLARSRLFAIPAAALGRGPSVQLAIRLNRGALANFGLTMSAGGTYSMTDAGRDLREENLLLIQQRKVERATTFVSAVLLLSFASLFAIFWLAERERVELLWLGLLTVTRGMFDLRVYALIALDSFPRGYPNWSSVFHTLNGVALAELIMAVAGLKSKWLRGIFWALWFGYYVSSTPGVNSWIDLAAMIMLLAGWWQTRREGRTADNLTMLTLLLVTLMHLNIGLRAFPSLVSIGGHIWSLTSFSMAFLSAILALLTLRRLLVDRREKQRLARELEAARLVQQLLFAAPTTGVTSVNAVYEPAQEVGGDFYQVYDHSSGARIVVVGDVSGKGLRAAMLVSLTVGTLRRDLTHPSQILAAMNETLVHHASGSFVTCCCACFESSGRVLVANAGHPSPYWNGKELAIEPGLPLGIAPDVEYPSAEFTIGTGDVVTLVSDGVVEATNTTGELFGFDRTREISEKPAQEIAAAAQMWGQNDDITVVTVRRQA